MGDGAYSAEHTLEALLTESAKNQQEVTDQLGLQVRKAVEVLIHSLDRADQDFGRALLADVSPEQLYESALTVMMRLVFLFCAEERELIPSKPFPVFELNYSVSTISKQLRELADQHGEELLERRYDAWPRLLAAFRAVYGGVRHHDVHLPAYGGSLFHPDRFPFLEGRARGTAWTNTPANPLPVNNRTVLHLLESLQYLQTKVPGSSEKTLRRISFRSLDIEQIGHVYEGLLDHTAKRAAEPFLGLAGSGGEEPEISLAALEQHRQKGEADLLKFLKDETDKTEKALKKALEIELDDQQVARFRTACQGDAALWQRVEPLAGLVRLDSFGYPVVIPQGSVFVTTGTDRRSSGTHYTPRSLTEPIVQYTLEPLVYVGPAEGLPKTEWKLKSAKELLDLKICDMACGSGAFLVQAARYMAERLLEAWDQAKAAYPQTPGITPEGSPSTGNADESLIPEDAMERKTFAMRIIAQRCLYGVDKNPLAAEMAKLSLWLLTLAKDKPFEFLDHSIRSGDSLVGLHNIDQLRYFSLKPDTADAVLFKGPLDNAVDEAIALRLKLEDLPTNTVEDVQRQERLLAEANEKIARLRCAADLLVSAEFWGENAKDKLERTRHAAVKCGYYVDQGPTAEFEEVAAKERRGQTMFHWPLEFPEVVVKRGGFDAFVGNPPFLGGTRISTASGIEYQRWLTNAFPQAADRCDLCAYFLRQVAELLDKSGSCGIIATNTISEGHTRHGGLQAICNRGYHIIRCRPNVSWPGSASLTVSLVWVSRQGGTTKYLNDKQVAEIGTDLTEGITVAPKPLAITPFVAGLGVKPYGAGFLLDSEEASKLKASKVVFGYFVGQDLNDLTTLDPERWIINFGDISEACAKEMCERCYDILAERVRPARLADRDRHRQTYWWQFERHAKEVYQATSNLPFWFGLSRVSKYHAIRPLPKGQVYSSDIVIFATSNYGYYAVLQSSFHSEWRQQEGSTHETRLRYTPSTSFSTFPFPDLTGETQEVGYQHIEQQSQIMSVRHIGLTKSLNLFHACDECASDILKLRALYTKMDQAVAAAYGWTDLDLGHGFHETKQGVRFTISEPARREVLQRLLKLNHERYAEEVRQGLHDKKKGGAKKSPPAAESPTPKKPRKSHPAQTKLFDLGDDQ